MAAKEHRAGEASKRGEECVAKASIAWKRCCN
jgi:hypothetical protein